MVERQLLRFCQSKVDELPLREPYDSAQLLDDLAASRGRPIHVTTLPWLAAPQLPCGVWIATGDTDHVFVQHGATGVHREQIVLHEIGHIVCGHGSTGSPELLQHLLPDIDPSMIEKVLQRSSYAQPQEREAELVATLALERMSRLAPRARRRQHTDAPNAILGRLDQVLGRDP